MDRKSFLATTSTLLVGGLATISFSKVLANKNHIHSKIKIPPYLQKGATIGICAPSGHIDKKEIMPCVQMLTDWGFKVWIGKTIGTKYGAFSGTDEQRINDLEEMMRNPNIDAILCARGGYGLIRIIDKIDFSSLQLNPKWIIGFSDITLLHNHLQERMHIASIHSKMCNSFPDFGTTMTQDQQNSILSIQKALLGKEKLQYEIAYNANNRMGNCEGMLIGGNHRTLENLSGTSQDFKTDHKILFLEDTHEPLENIDRMFWNFKRSGKLAKLKGLIIGGYKLPKQEADDDTFLPDFYNIILEKVKAYNYPICFHFPVGHQINNVALKCGVRHALDVNDTNTILKEL